MSTAPVDGGRVVERRAGGPAGRSGAIVDPCALAAMISIGHGTGLFDVIATLPPSTSAAIAARTGLGERQVREWLAMMAGSGIVDYDPVRRTYSLAR